MVPSRRNPIAHSTQSAPFPPALTLMQNLLTARLKYGHGNASKGLYGDEEDTI